MVNLMWVQNSKIVDCNNIEMLVKFPIQQSQIKVTVNISAAFWACQHF